MKMISSTRTMSTSGVTFIAGLARPPLLFFDRPIVVLVRRARS